MFSVAYAHRSDGTMRLMYKIMPNNDIKYTVMHYGTTTKQTVDRFVMMRVHGSNSMGMCWILQSTFRLIRRKV